MQYRLVVEDKEPLLKSKGLAKITVNSLLTETHKELKRVTCVHRVRISSFDKYHIWKHKESVHE